MSEFADLGDTRICWDTRGDKTGVPLVLVRGLGTQMTEWSEVLLGSLVEKGHYVILLDNRDIGLSSGFEEAGIEKAAYSLTDMASDVAGLLDHLGIESAHIAGMSMGGMIAQRMGLDFRDHTRSVISIMSSSGRPTLPPPTEEAAFYLTARPETDDEDAVVEVAAKGRKVFDGGGYPVDIETHREALRASYRRAYRPDGVARQLLAIWADTDRPDALASLDVPTLVIHGTDDSLLQLGHGVDTAKSIPGARLEVVEGMGHAIPDALAPLIAELITTQTQPAG